jgi:CHAT domain-containing protein/Tfp pilus assembly protein PilF
VALSDKGDFPKALAVLEEAENLQRKLSPRPEIQADLLTNRGKIYRSQGLYQEALDSFKEAAVLYRQLPVRLKEAQALNNIGLAKEALGQFAPALSDYEQAREIARQLGAANLEVKAELHIANNLFETGKYQPAVQAYLDLLPKASANTEPPVVMAIHNNLGTSFLRLGDFAKADLYFAQALDAARGIGNKEFEASLLTNRSQIRAQAHHLDLAKADAWEAWGIWSGLGNEVMANRVLVNLGWLTISEGSSEEGIETFQRGLESSRRAGLAADALRFSLLIGALHLQRGDSAAAAEQAVQATADADRIGDWAGQYVGRSMLMVSHFLQGDSTAALKYLNEVVSLLERLQSGLTLSELKGPFLAQFFNDYAWGVLINAEMGRTAEAFDFAERARSRAFRDQIGNQRIKMRKGMDSGLVQQEEELRARLAYLGEAIEKERNGSKGELLANLMKAREEAQRDYATLLTRLKLANPEYAALVSVNTLSLREVQQVLDEDTTLIEYFVPDAPGHEEGSKVLAWVVDRQSVHMIGLPIKTDDLENEISNFRALISHRDSVQAQGARLYQELFAPLLSHVRHRNLVIVPHGLLHYLPFAALWDPTRQSYLGDAYALSYSPSATVLRFAREKTARAVGPVVVAGNPDGSLPDAALEARAVARLQGGRPLLGQAATEGTVVARAGQAGILHLAAHAELNLVNPLFTRIKLAPSEGNDGNLEMHEVFGLDLSKTGLVVLSACSTQIGQLSAGDEIEGLTRAFLYAGTPAVMASLWNVSDESTALFMERFYTHLRKGKGRAEALRRAQLETRRKFPHPYHWAAFVLTGDGR